MRDAADNAADDAAADNAGQMAGAIDYPSASLGPEGTVRFDIVKSDNHRVIHVDGALASTGLQGGIVLSLYHQRRHWPDRLVHSIEEGAVGKLVPEETVQREGILREYEVTAHMVLNTAIALRALLDRQIVKAQAATERLRVARAARVRPQQGRPQRAFQDRKKNQG